MNTLNHSQKTAARSRSGGLQALFLLAGLLALATPLRADNPPTYLFQIDASAVPGGFSPYYLALDSSNNLYVTDTLSNRVVKFSASGTYLTQWGSLGSGSGQFYFPRGVAVDSSNNVYVVDGNNGRVEKFDNNGNYLTEISSAGGGGFDPADVAVDGSNNVYVADESNSRVEKFDSNGNFLVQWDTLSALDPVGIAASTGKVYVTELGYASANAVQEFDNNGNYLAQLGTGGSGPGEFYAPVGIALDNSNNVYIADEVNYRIQKFDRNGNYLARWGTEGDGPGQFETPQGVAVDGTGNYVYVADEGNSRIQAFANNVGIIPPIITNEPASQIVPAGGNVTFGVGVVGGKPFGYQWTSNNVALSGATNATLTLTNVSLAASGGIFSVLVANSYGNALSSNAGLTVVPAVALTQPASSIATTGAVLNASVAVGFETVAWFEWGTDTNYGNITDATILAGNSGSTNVSAALSGLPGDVYHYRIDAANDLGIVYGNDVSFTIGSAPTAISLAAVVSTNGATLNATVNPNGWDTTVRFAWQKGTSTYGLTNSTPGTDIGAGATALNVSSLISGLAPASSYTYQVVASNHLGIVYAGVVTFLSSPFTGAPLEAWQSVACSADGTKLVAGAEAATGGSTLLYTSTNSGAAWTLVTNVTGVALGLASSADGTKLVAKTSAFIYISTNAGATWASARNAPEFNWRGVASSADGAKLSAVPYGVGIYTSTNSGVNWTHQTNGLPASMGFSFIASSADGSKLVTAPGSGVSGPIFASTNCGVNWTQATNSPSANWGSVASSADGNTLLACANGGYVYFSTNAGVIWTKTGLLSKEWLSVAESADGTKMVALANNQYSGFGIGNGGIFTSTNSGTTWVSNNVPSAAWTCAAMSADGNEIIAAIASPLTGGGIYISQLTPAPVLNLSVADNVISWLVPSMDFSMQQSPDLLNWTNVANPPVLNLSNLQQQVALPAPLAQSFYRLKH